MKQARAFGIGVVLATQNPVDLDYKGLGNAGTWFIGRLQTERDKARVIEGLLGSEAAGGLDRAGFEALMSNLTQRTFLMRNVHDDAPVLFRTRWALSYLRGPLTLAEIRRLTAASAPATPEASSGAAASAPVQRLPPAPRRTPARRRPRVRRPAGRAARRHGAIPRRAASEHAALHGAHRRPRAGALRDSEGRPRHLADGLLPGARRSRRPGLGTCRGHPAIRARSSPPSRRRGRASPTLRRPRCPRASTSAGRARSRTTCIATSRSNCSRARRSS